MAVQVPQIDHTILTRFIRDEATLAKLIHDMDICSQQHDLAKANRDSSAQRNQKRKRFRVDCKVRFFLAGEGTITVFPGRTRNISQRGLGLVVRRCFLIDEPLEVEINVPTHPALFLYGQVRFCRYVGRGYHEVGILLKSAGSTPILSHDLAFAEKMGSAQK